MNNRYFTYFRLLLLAVFAISLSGCRLDERPDELSAGYEGAFISKIDGKQVATEYYGAKIKLLDLAYGEVAQPLSYNTLPDGSYRNTKVYPSEYKMYAEGPFCAVDTIWGPIDKQMKINLNVTPNVAVEIKNVEIKYGIAADVTIGYKVYDETSESQEIGLVWGFDAYPGYRDAMDETNAGYRIYKRIKTGLTELEGEFTETVYLNPGTKYYLRAAGRVTKSAYWNYSEQKELEIGALDLSALPVAGQQGMTGGTCAVIQWAFPPVLAGIKVSYTDRDGLAVSDTFSPDGYSYVANLPHNSTTTIKVQLLGEGDVAGPEQDFQIKTKSADQALRDQNDPANVPEYDDLAVRQSISSAYAAKVGMSKYGEDWANNTSRHLFIKWWLGWTWANDRQPKIYELEEFTELMIEGEIKTLVDLLTFVNLETLTIQAGELFDVGLTIDPGIDLHPLTKLKKLRKVVIGPGVPLTKKNFDEAGFTSLEVVNQ